MAEYFLRAALWQLPTMVSNAPDGARNVVAELTHDERCRLLEERLKAASRIFASIEPPSGATVIDVFAAPEYLFAASAITHFVDVSTKDRILAKLKQMTERYPQVLLFPGTIAWKKPMKESGTFGKNRSKTAYRRLENMTATHASGKGNYDQHKDRLDKARADRTLKGTFFAQNTAYVMRGGRLVLKYHKLADGGEVFKEDREDGMVIWVPGERKAAFTIDGLDVGLEICAERGAGILRKMGVGELDVHVMISASHPANESTTLARNGGYLLHADAHHPPAAYRRGAGGVTVVKERFSFEAKGGRVSYYGLPLTK
jgi:hypothetical protein